MVQLGLCINIFTYRTCVLMLALLLSVPCSGVTGRADSSMLQVSALNEAVAGSAVSVLRPWQQRLDLPLPNLDSNEDDPELLIHIPFDGTVKLKVCCFTLSVPVTTRHGPL